MGDTGLEPGRGARVRCYPPCLLGSGDLRFAEICSERNLEWNLWTSRRGNPSIMTVMPLLLRSYAAASARISR